MSVYNTLITDGVCPHCCVRSEVHADFRFGLRDQTDYRIGETLRWLGKGVRTPGARPCGGNYSGEAYTECPHCSKEFWLLIEVRADVITEANTDWDREEYAAGDQV